VLVSIETVRFIVRTQSTGFFRECNAYLENAKIHCVG
jgi:hypothetical protein